MISQHSQNKIWLYFKTSERDNLCFILPNDIFHLWIQRTAVSNHWMSIYSLLRFATIRWKDTRFQCLLSGLFLFARQWGSAWYFVSGRSPLPCKSNHNKLSNRHWGLGVPPSVMDYHLWIGYYTSRGGPLVTRIPVASKTIFTCQVLKPP